MVNKMRIGLLLATLAAVTCGCVSVKHASALVPPSGAFADFQAPLVVPRGPVPCEGLKVGKGSRSVYLKEWVYTGLSVDVTDMTLKQAMEDGGISHLLYADYEQYSLLGFVTLFTVTAYGR